MSAFRVDRGAARGLRLTGQRTEFYRIEFEYDRTRDGDRLYEYDYEYIPYSTDMSTAFRRTCRMGEVNTSLEALCNRPSNPVLTIKGA